MQMLKSKRNVMLATFAIVLLLVLVCILVTQVMRLEKIKADREALLSEIETLYDERDELEQTKEFLERIEYAEQRARELGLIKEGETIWALVD